MVAHLRKNFYWPEKIKKEDFANMTKSKGRPVIMSGLESRGHYGLKSRITGNVIDLAGLGNH